MIKLPKKVKEIPFSWPMFRGNLQRTGTGIGKHKKLNFIFWKFKTDGGIESSPAVYRSKVFFGSNDNHLYCLDIETRKGWMFKTGNDVHSSPAVYGNKVFFGSDDYHLYCLDIETGKLIWKFKTGNNVHSSPAVYGNKVFFGSHDTYLYCLDIETGNIIWKYRTGNYVRSSPAVYGNKVFFGSFDYLIYCVDIETGNLIWNFKTKGCSVYSSPAVYGNKVFFGSFDYLIYCVNIETGKKIWEHQTKDIIYSSPAIYGNKIFLGSRDNNLYCIDIETGRELWTILTNGNVRSSPAIYENKVFFGSEDKHLYCVDIETGNLIWKFKTGDKILSSPAVYGNKVFFGSYDNYLYAMDVDIHKILLQKYVVDKHQIKFGDVYNINDFEVKAINTSENSSISPPISQQIGKYIFKFYPENYILEGYQKESEKPTLTHNIKEILPEKAVVNSYLFYGNKLIIEYNNLFKLEVDPFTGEHETKYELSLKAIKIKDKKLVIALPENKEKVLYETAVPITAYTVLSENSVAIATQDGNIKILSITDEIKEISQKNIETPGETIYKLVHFGKDLIYIELNNNNLYYIIYNINTNEIDFYECGSECGPYLFHAKLSEKLTLMQFDNGILIFDNETGEPIKAHNYPKAKDIWLSYKLSKNYTLVQIDNKIITINNYTGYIISTYEYKSIKPEKILTLSEKYTLVKLDKHILIYDNETGKIHKDIHYPSSWKGHTSISDKYTLIRTERYIGIFNNETGKEIIRFEAGKLLVKKGKDILFTNIENLVLDPGYVLEGKNIDNPLIFNERLYFQDKGGELVIGYYEEQ